MSDKRNAKAIIAAPLILASLLFLHFTLHGFGPTSETAAHEALGETLAQEALKVRGSGGRITVIARDTSLQKNPFADAQLKSFQRTIRKARATNSNVLVKLNPIRLTAVPPGDFFDLIKKRSEEDVIVSLIGPPGLSDKQVSLLGDKRPKILAVCSGWTPRQVDLRRIFEQGLLTTAVISRDESGKGAAGGSSESFNKSFALITPSNVSDLPLVARAGAK
jgi:hypothetical protein